MTPDHWRLFSEFCRYEKEVGGPDPQLAMIVHAGRDLPLEDRVWGAGCYGAVYNTGGALVLWNKLPRSTVLGMGEDELRAWLVEHWDGIPFRRERRAVRTPDKLARYLRSYALQSHNWPERAWWRNESSPANYEVAWADVNRVYGVGRYIAIKLLELFHRLGAGTAAYDIRAREAWSPRQALALLWPQHARTLNEDQSRVGSAHAESIANTTLAVLRDDWEVEVSHFELQVMTCEYRESIESRRQYPGHSHDSEDRYLQAVVPHWGRSLADDGYQARKALFPAASLGELAGWEGNREDLGPVAAEYGYTWSDLRYDYLTSRGHLAHPNVRVLV